MTQQQESMKQHGMWDLCDLAQPYGCLYTLAGPGAASGGSSEAIAEALAEANALALEAHGMDCHAMADSRRPADALASAAVATPTPR